LTLSSAFPYSQQSGWGTTGLLPAIKEVSEAAEFRYSRCFAFRDFDTGVIRKMNNLFDTTMTQLEQSLTCELIASEIDLEGGVKSASVGDEELLEFATRCQYSRVPLKDKRFSEATPITHVAIIDIHNKRVVERRQIAINDLIAGETPLSKAVEVLRKRGFCFVIVHDEIKKILTRSDLNKLPMRVYLTTLLAHLEGLLANAIHKAFPNDQWLDKLSEENQRGVNDLFEEKKKNDFDTRKIDCTTLSYKSTIVQKSHELRQELSNCGRDKFNDLFKKTINRLRNRLEHGLPALTEEDNTLRDHLYHNQQLTKETDVEWLAEVILTLRAWIDCLTQSEQEAVGDDT